ncbi:MAG: amino acid adenylation domain-containing protein, partial [bacterium]|nr:amino acid adenylation domain-containing protein [bacterium]
MKTLQAGINESLKKNKENTAIQWGNRSVSYAELDKLSNTIARQLIAEGVEKETFIGILLENRLDIIASILGVLKAGCVFVPL